MTGEIAAVARGAGMRSAVASPIVVEGRLWGAMVVLSPRPEPLPAGTEARLTDFAELVATAIAMPSRASRSAGSPMSKLRSGGWPRSSPKRFPRRRSSARSPGRRCSCSAPTHCESFSYDGESGVVIAGSGEPAARTPPGFRFPLNGETVAVTHLPVAGEPSRQDDYADTARADDRGMRPLHTALRMRSAWRSPIVVEGELWGAIMTGNDSGGAASAGHGVPAGRVHGADRRRRSRTQKLVTKWNGWRKSRRRCGASRRSSPGRAVHRGLRGRSDRSRQAVRHRHQVVGRYDGDGAATAIGSWSASG